MTLQNSFVRIAQRLVGLGLAFAFLASVKVAAANGGKTFPTPQAAVDALAAAVNAKDRQALRTLFGLATDELVAADKVQAENELTEFSAAFNQSNRIVPESDSKCYLEVGSHRWPFPIPLAKRDGGWFFDTEAGKEELLNRRIGKNELATLQTIRAYVDAQRAYASRDRDNDGVLEYAQKLLSSPGRKNGLFWPPDLDGEISPLGPLVAYGQTEGYALRPTEANPSPQPFHGYYYRMLTRQGNHAPGGKYNYIINGNMIGGFALVAYPANYGESGIMTFIVNQQGVVYQKDLGAKTARSAAAMKSYDPDSTWLASPD
ncbi:MAG TPA: DUF2950 domain-containing protein [Candidatus Paceibacterota bacterium]|nr:DUF2950 domain-containing protein [Verrucomicrobiota bacterium]HRY51968.1 DUF2950 domain-containing protein [Candidatus Paceibacterota bacterium]HSA00207.1 DUF2950 domain-containing protein [Candidatus Paceibacterota bacterium]